MTHKWTQDDTPLMENDTPIRTEWFHWLEGEKTKLNWFLLEIALEYFDRIRSSPALAAYRDKYGEEQVAQFCAYYARRMRNRLLGRIRGRRKLALANQEYIDDFYPGHGGGLNGELNKVAGEACEGMLAHCRNCPNQCLGDYRSRSPLFDEIKG